ncbi:hypothetical protein TRL7639_00172 [Falsiruegeria litorea R37]|uniref:NAD-dependent epimerase/dehydratase domain-containing protein n=1 Tax=Falsiruegeria litorea R37 TaxID=1200284 RepID=A0A1Y5RBX9_9RHOB|nr:NAD-dependent epimerase/dehydratase family protein [Falsiruegeria litorea]SLN13869.1 hypothetical protein TRL7639_00172 [Falsiruegeria litorea R37]
MKVLVIGGSGFVGRALIPALLNSGHDVSVLNRGNQRIEVVTQLVADRDDPAAVGLHQAAYDVVVDTSGYTKQQVEIAFSAFGPSAGRWIHLSSAAVYRETPHLPTEDDQLGGAEVWGEYGADKSEVDEFLTKRTECPIAILRPPYLYGPNNANDRETFVWSRVLSGRPVIVPGDGSAQLQFLHVQDLARIIVRFAETNFGQKAIYNVAEPETMNAETWVRKVAAASGEGVSIIHARNHAVGIAARQFFPFRDYPCALDVSRFVRDFRWDFTFSFNQGIENTFLSYDRDALVEASATTDGEKRILNT